MDHSARDRSTIREALAALGFAVAVILVGGAPAAVFGSETAWIDRPSFYPPEILFPIVWTVLFALLGVALYLVVRRGLARRDVRVAVSAFAVQFALNLTWTPAFFGLRRPDIGLAVIVLLWVAIVGTIYAFARVDRRAALLLLPYLAWVSFATALNYAIYVRWA